MTKRICVHIDHQSNPILCEEDIEIALRTLYELDTQPEQETHEDFIVDIRKEIELNANEIEEQLESDCAGLVCSVEIIEL